MGCDTQIVCGRGETRATVSASLQMFHAECEAPAVRDFCFSSTPNCAMSSWILRVVISLPIYWMNCTMKINYMLLYIFNNIVRNFRPLGPVPSDLTPAVRLRIYVERFLAHATRDFGGKEAKLTASIQKLVVDQMLERYDTSAKCEAFLHLVQQGGSSAGGRASSVVGEGGASSSPPKMSSSGPPRPPSHFRALAPIVSAFADAQTMIGRWALNEYRSNQCLPLGVAEVSSAYYSPDSCGKNSSSTKVSLVSESLVSEGAPSSSAGQISIKTPTNTPARPGQKLRTKHCSPKRTPPATKVSPDEEDLVKETPKETPPKQLQPLEQISPSDKKEFMVSNVQRLVQKFFRFFDVDTNTVEINAYMHPGDHAGSESQI